MKARPFVSAALFVIGSPSSFAALVSVPYFQDFSSITGTTSTEIATAIGATQSPTGYLNLANTSTNPALRAQIASGSTASASFNTALVGTNNFTISTRLLANTLNTGGSSVETPSMIYSLAGAGATNLTNTYRLNIDFLQGTIGLGKAGTALTGVGVSGTMPSLALNNQLSVSLSGVYLSASEVAITGIVSDGTNTYTLTYTDSSSIYTGDYFGFTSSKNLGAGVGTFSVLMDDFSINVVPEPSAEMLAAAGAGVFLLGKRRRIA